MDLGQRSARHSHCRVFNLSGSSLAKKPQIMCLTFSPLSSPFWPSTPALLHMHDIPPTPARLPDFPILATKHGRPTLARPFSPNAIPALSLSLSCSIRINGNICWVGPSPQAHPPLLTMQSRVAANIQGVQAQYASRPTSLNPTPHYLLSRA